MDTNENEIQEAAGSSQTERLKKDGIRDERVSPGMSRARKGAFGVMKLAMVQMQTGVTEQDNLAKGLKAIDTAAAQGADFILFPELQLTRFFPQYPGRDARHYSHDIQSETVRMFQESCRRNNVFAAPNIYLFERGSYYDASILIDRNGSVLGIQKMVHIAQAYQFYEKDYYRPSDTGFQVFETEFGKIGLVICFDRHYPESIRTEALMGADLILIPTANTKSEPLEMFEWEIRVQAYQNSAAIAMCNRVGREDAMEFAGESLAADAAGSLLIKADDQEQILYTEIDLSASAKIRSETPYTNLRRPEWYQVEDHKNEKEGQ